MKPPPHEFIWRDRNRHSFLPGVLPLSRAMSLLEKLAQADDDRLVYMRAWWEGPIFYTGGCTVYKYTYICMLIIIVITIISIYMARAILMPFVFEAPSMRVDRHP